MPSVQYAINKVSSLLRKLKIVTGTNFVWRFTDTNWLRYLPKEQQEHWTSYCRKIKRKPYEKLKECIINHRENTIRKALELRSPFLITCHAGITEAVVPIFVNDRYRGSIFIGPFATENIPPYPAIEKEYRQLPRFDSEKVEAIQDMVSEILRIFILEFQDTNDDNRQVVPELKARDQRIFQAVSFMRKNFRKNLQVSMVAQFINLSTSRFLHLFSSETGFSFSDYMQRLRVNEARRLLETTNLSLGEISIESGINSQSRMTVLFKRYYDKLPKEYRNFTL